MRLRTIVSLSNGLWRCHFHMPDFDGAGRKYNTADWSFARTFDRAAANGAISFERNMDSKTLFFAVGVLVVLVVLRVVRHFSRKWLEGRPMWVALVFPAVLAACVFLLVTHFNVASIAECLQGNTFAACTSSGATTKPAQQ
jgi:hypothetical protein